MAIKDNTVGICQKVVRMACRVNYFHGNGSCTESVFVVHTVAETVDIGIYVICWVAAKKTVGDAYLQAVGPTEDMSIFVMEGNTRTIEVSI